MRGQVLDVDNLSITTRSGNTLVDRVGISVGPGETLGIVGESGSGKSLTLRAVAGILPSTLVISGAIDRTPATAMIFQEPATALNPTMRVGDLVARTWKLHHAGSDTRAAKVSALSLFEQVGIAKASERMRAWPHELSGGMRQRVMIAAALATNPDLLLCDEPTTALDVRIQAQILSLLRSLVDTSDLALVFVSHDLAVVSSLCERLVVMRSGRIIEEGLSDAMLEDPQEAYTAELLAANLAHRLSTREMGRR